MTFFYILLSTLLVSSGSLIGIFTLHLNQEYVKKIVLWLVALSAGTLLGGAFWHLLPEAIVELPVRTAFGLVIFSYIAFFFLENILHWHHCHLEDHHHLHAFGTLNLLGDSVHNFLDGLVIAAAFSTSPTLGIVTTLGVALHEIPQEIGDFGVLLASGYKAKRALWLNFLAAFTVVLGGVAGWLLSGMTSMIVPYLLPIAAGSFIYIASTDLVPQIKNHDSLKHSLSYLAVFILGLAITFTLTLLEVDSHA